MMHDGTSVQDIFSSFSTSSILDMWRRNAYIESRLAAKIAVGETLDWVCFAIISLGISLTSKDAHDAERPTTQLQGQLNNLRPVFYNAHVCNILFVGLNSYKFKFQVGSLG